MDTETINLVIVIIFTAIGTGLGAFVKALSDGKSIKKVSTQANALEESVNKLVSQNIDLTDKNKELTEVLEVVKVLQDERSAVIDDLTRRLETQEDVSRDQQQKIKALETTVATLQQEKAEVTSERDSLRVELTEISAKFVRVNDELKEAKDLIHQQDRRIIELEARRSADREAWATIVQPIIDSFASFARAVTVPPPPRTGDTGELKSAA